MGIETDKIETGSAEPEPNTEEKKAQWKRINSEVSRLNAQHALAVIGGKTRIINQFKKPLTNEPDFSISSIQDFRARYSNRLFKHPESGKEKNIADYWIASPKRRQFDNGIGFFPGYDIPDYFNLWQGFRVEPKKGDWRLFKKHLFEVIVNEDHEQYEWVIAWMSRIVKSIKYPNDKTLKRPGTSIVMCGGQGTGKGSFVRPWEIILGKGIHFVHLYNQGLLTGRFNSHLKNALVVFCDEGFFAGDKSAEGYIKGMITEGTIMIEQKGEDAYAVDNHINLIVASNSEWVIPAGIDDRRFFVTEVSDRYKVSHNSPDYEKNKAYFDALRDEIDNGGAQAMLYDLLEHDISDVDLYTAPKTEALIKQKEHSMSIIQKFWYQCLSDGSNMHDGTWADWIPSEVLFNRFKEFSAYIGVKRNPDPRQLGRQLKTICKRFERYRNPETMRWGYLCPDLETCRKEFEHILNFDIKWE